MKQICFFVAAVFLSTALVAQDYRAYVPNRTAYFHSNSMNNWWFYENTHAITEDSVWQNGSWRTVASYPEATIATNWFDCLAFDTTWVGLKIEQDTTTFETRFFNTLGDTIEFYPNATVGQTAVFCRLWNGHIIRGLVASTVQMNFLSVTDSVKIITLAAEDAMATPVVHQINGKQIHLAKQHGVIRGYAWRDFPADTLSYSLSGMSNPSIGAHNIQAAQIFDFNIGDRFDWYEGTNSNAMQFPTMYHYYSRVITSKTVNGDTITYGYTQDYVQKIGTTIMTQLWGQTGSVQYITTVYDTTYKFYEQPFELGAAPDSTLFFYTNEYATMPYAPSVVNGRQLKGFYSEYPYYWDSNSQCFIGATVSFGPCDGYESVYGDGIGKVHGSGGSATCFSMFNLVYYSKGNETWGTPHNWSVILSDEQIATQMQTGMALFPNPAEDILNAQIPDKNATKATYRIYSISGQLISQAQGDVSAGSLQILVNQMENGLYLIEVETENGIWTGRFAK
jgi:hypothetical protein